MANFTNLVALGGLLALTGTTQAQTFAPVATYFLGTGGASPYTIAVADANGDGKPDLFTANNLSGTVAVLLGAGGGTFQPAATYAVGAGSGPRGLATADVNGDTKIDLLTSNNLAGTVGVLLGTGTGTFQPAATYAVGAGTQPWAIAAADVNGDGKPDLLTANYSNHTAGVLLNSGTGTFQPAVNYSTGLNSTPSDIAVADVNGDGKPDLLLANSSSGTIGVLLGTGMGTFLPVVPYSTGANSQPFALAVADVNNDNKLDLLAAIGNMLTVKVLLGNGDGTFQTTNSFSAPSGGQAFDIAAADVNGDGKLDLLTANGPSFMAGVLLGNGNGTFQPVAIYATNPTSYPVSIGAADVNGDNRLDLLTANSGSNSVGVLLNTTPTPLATRATLPGTSATLHPNPATAATALTVAGLPATVAQVQATLLDATGRAVGQQRLATAQGSARADITTAGLAAGFYVLRLTAHDAQGQPIGSLPAQRLGVR